MGGLGNILDEKCDKNTKLEELKQRTEHIQGKLRVLNSDSMQVAASNNKAPSAGRSHRFFVSSPSYLYIRYV